MESLLTLSIEIRRVKNDHYKHNIMRKISLLSTALLIGLTTYGQFYLNGKKTFNEKQSLNVAYKWDSIIVHDTNGTVYRHTQQINWQWGKPASKKIEKFDGVTWNDSILTTYAYDSLGRKKSELEQRNKAGSLINFMRIYQYYGMLVDSSFTQSWHDTAWENNYKGVKHYFNNGDLATSLSYYWSQNQWKLTTETSYLSYTAQHNVINYISNFFSTHSSMGNYTYVSTPDGQEKELTYTIQTFNNFDSVWENDMKIEYVYDSNFNIIEHYLKYWVNGNWTLNQGGYAIFDNSNNRINYTWRTYDTTTGNWNDKYRLLTTFDNNHNSIHQVCEQKTNSVWHSGMWVLMLNNNSDWYIIMETGSHHSFDAFFKPYYDGLNETDLEELVCYPNPTADYLRLNKSYHNIKIYSITGSKIIELQNAQLIDMSKFSPGIYMLIINDMLKVKILKQ
jgi:hypothetical protein